MLRIINKLDTKLCLPLCKANEISLYSNPVYGNKIQKLQIDNKNNFYETNKINEASHNIRKHVNNNCIFLPTSHNTPIKTALQSCRNLDSTKFVEKINLLNITDRDGVFINNYYNKEKLLNLLSLCKGSKELSIMNYALKGIISNFGDSIYIANDFLRINNNHIIISNYPDKVSQREIERCRIVAYSLLLGNYPIILDNDIEFEGEANIKMLPAIIKKNNKLHRMCLNYDSSRSNSKCINNINKYLDKLNLPLLEDIKLKPKIKSEELFYHLDCLLNFSTSDKIQFFNSIDDFWKNYNKNGTLVLEKSGIDIKYRNILKKLFNQIIYVKKEDDLLCANMIVLKDTIIGSSKISNKKLIPNYHHFNHPSYGGGGAHKCCSNFININEELTINDWFEFNKKLDINLSKNFIEGVKSEMFRLNNFFK